MSLAVRIIPCLDVRGGRVVKGINFKDIVDAGDPAEAAKRYDAEGADEICMLDIDASFEERSTTIETVKSIASQVFIPFTVGGGIKSLKDIDMLLKSGADKVSINTSAILNPELIEEASKEYGAQCIVLAIDAKKDGEIWNVYTHGGKNKTKLDAIDWAKKEIPSWIFQESDFVCIRCLQDDFFKNLVGGLSGKAIITTSLNLNGEPPILNQSDAQVFREKHAPSASIIQSDKQLLSGHSSTIVRFLASQEIQVIRKGQRFEDVLKQLKVLSARVL